MGEKTGKQNSKQTFLNTRTLAAAVYIKVVS